MIPSLPRISVLVHCLDHVLHGAARRDHGQDVDVGRDLAVHQDGALLFQGRPQDGLHLPRRGDPHAGAAEGLGQFDEIGFAMRIGSGEPPPVKHLLPLPHHAQHPVVHHHHHDGKVIGCQGGQLIQIHMENCRPRRPAPPAGREGRLGADGSPQAVSHGSQAPRGQQCAGLPEGEMLGGPHLVLAHIGGDDSIVREQAPEGAHLQGIGRGVWASPWKRESPASGPSPGPPRPDGPVCPPAGKGCPIHPQIPGQPDRHRHILIELGVVDIYMDHLSVWSETGGAPRYPVGKPGTAGQEQIALPGRAVGRQGTVHSHHSQP